MSEARPRDEDTAAASGRTRLTAATTRYSMTSSARPSSATGTSTPSALAVLRLITSSTLVTCCTGRSAGFSPFRIRPGINARKAIGIGVEAAIADQATIVGELAIKIHRRQGMARCQGDELGSPCVEDRVCGEGDRADPFRCETRERGINVLLVARMAHMQLESECLGPRLHIAWSLAGTRGFSG